MTAAALGLVRGNKLRRGLIMATAIFATAMYVVDIFVVGIALPRMQGTFSATPDQISWVATSFILGTTIMIVATGWLSARVGIRRLFALSIAGFMVLMVLAANATTLEEEVLWRLLMGMVGAPINPLCQIIILNNYPRGRHAQALATWGVGVMIAPVVALPVGGMVIDAVGWPGVFYMNLPVAGMALFGAIAFVPRTQDQPGARLDWFGLTMLMVMFVLIQFVLSRGARLDWFESTTILVAVAVAGLCGYSFLVHVFTTRNPLVPPAMFRDRNFAFGLVGTFFFGTTNMMVPILLPLMLQNQFRYPVDLIGLVMAPRTIGTLIGQYLVAVLITRMDPRHLIAMGAITSSIATWFMAGWTADVGPLQVIWPAVLHGISGGFLWVTFNAITVSTLDARYRNQAVPLYFLSFNVGFSFGVAGIMTYWANSAQRNHAMLSEFVTPFNEAMRGPLLPPGWNPADPAVAATLAGEIGRQATMIAYNNSFMVAAALALAIVPLGYLLVNPRRGGREW